MSLQHPEHPPELAVRLTVPSEFWTRPQLLVGLSAAEGESKARD